MATAFARRQFNGGPITTTIPTGMASGDGTFTLAASTGWPDGSVGNFSVVVDRGAGAGVEEKILCASRSGLVVTVAASGRGYDGTSAVAHNPGCPVQCCHVAQDDDEANQLVANLGNVAKGAIILGGGVATLPGALAALAEGSLMYGKGTGNNPVALAVGANGTMLKSNGTDPLYGVIAGTMPLTPALITTTQACVAGTAYAATSGTFTATLPAPAVGATVQVTNYGSGVVTVSQHSAEKIFGLGMTSSGVNTFALGTPGATATLLSLDGVSWWVVAGQQDSGWVAITPLNSWTNLNSAGYRITGNVVRLRGQIGSGSSDTAAFNLPAGYRPTETPTAFVTTASTTASSANIAWVKVDTAGNVSPEFASGLGALTMDGMTFTVD